MKFLLLLVTMLFQDLWLDGAEFEIQLGEIRDTRVSDRPGTLEVELKLTGDRIGEAKCPHVVVEKAMDDTSSSLAKEQPVQAKTITQVEVGRKSLILSSVLKQPDRRARKLIAVSGWVEFFVPSPDDFINLELAENDGREFVSKGNPETSVHVTVMLSENFAAWRKASLSDPKMPTADTRPLSRVSDNLPAGLRDLFRNMGTFPMEIDDKTIALRLKDPAHRLIELVVYSPKGEVIKVLRMGDYWLGGVDTRLLEVGETIVPGMRAQLLLANSKSSVRERFSFSGIKLP